MLQDIDIDVRNVTINLGGVSWRQTERRSVQRGLVNL